VARACAPVAPPPSLRLDCTQEPQGFIGGVDYPVQYMPLYNASARALKAVDSRLRVGGPVTADLGHLDDFIRRTHSAGLPLDFVSSHFYPSGDACTHPTASPHRRMPSELTSEQRRHSRKPCFVESVLNASRAVEETRRSLGLPPLDFLLTEYNSGLQGGPGTGYGGNHSDGAYAAAFAVLSAPALSSIPAASWWTFSDIFDEGWLTGEPFYGGYGLLSTHGVRKPAYRAFELLSGSGDRMLSESDGVTVHDPSPDLPDGESSISAVLTHSSIDRRPASRSVDGARSRGETMGLQVFLTNFGPMEGATAGAPWQPRARNISLRIQGIAGGGAAGGADKSPRAACVLPTVATLRRIDDEATNPLATWRAQGSPSYPTKEQLAALHAASKVPMETVRLVQDPHASTSTSSCGTAAVTLQLMLPPYGIAHLSDFR
jgi:xylan 1,4-beta-xylosidase